jgi:hypothetical protein
VKSKNRRGHHYPSEESNSFPSCESSQKYVDPKVEKPAEPASKKNPSPKTRKSRHDEHPGYGKLKNAILAVPLRS